MTKQAVTGAELACAYSRASARQDNDHEEVMTYQKLALTDLMKTTGRATGTPTTRERCGSQR